MYIRKKLVIVLLFLCMMLSGCVLGVEYVNITTGTEVSINQGEQIQLSAVKTMGIVDPIVWSTQSECISVDNNGLVTGLSEGIGTVYVTAGNYSDNIIIYVNNESVDTVSIHLSTPANTIAIGDIITLEAIVTPASRQSEVKYEIVSSQVCGSLNGAIFTATQEGMAIVQAYIGDIKSNTVTITIEKEITDPYMNMSAEEFYRNYTEAKSYMDAYYRSLHGFMSGSIAAQDQEPTISSYQPKQNGALVRNATAYYSSDGNTYYIVNAYGEIVNHVYRGGGYVTLEEVAAYVLAFGDIPANYVSSKNATPTNSIWGEYLRLNHSSFSGSTSKYPYEPELPNISGCGGDLYYYEIDLGTTGTDCDPKYDVTEYNDGYDITRGAARIVYTRYDKNKNEIIDVNEKYVFYTYNHYNDFQEYLNYEGGWGEMFGNITGGGTLSSKNHYNPTPYVETSRMAFVITNQYEYFAGSTDNVSYILLEKNKEKWYYI